MATYRVTLEFIGIELVILLNGIFDLLIGVGLLVGILVKPLGLIAAIHLLVIAYGLGYNDVMVRDLGLAAMGLAIFFHGPDEYCWKS